MLLRRDAKNFCKARVPSRYPPGSQRTTPCFPGTLDRILLFFHTLPGTVDWLRASRWAGHPLWTLDLVSQEPWGAAILTTYFLFPSTTSDFAGASKEQEVGSAPIQFCSILCCTPFNNVILTTRRRGRPDPALWTLTGTCDVSTKAGLS